MEKQIFFPVLGNNARVKRALANHRRIRKLLSCGCDHEKVLNLLEEELSAYLRSEETGPFERIQSRNNTRTIIVVEREHTGSQINKETWGDEFWKV